jgi:hypothetical protein
MPSPGPFRAALTALAGLNVPGVRHNYGIEALPEALPRGSLPALVLVPMLDSMRRNKYGDFQTAAPSGTQALSSYLITHLLIYAPTGNGIGARSALPGLVDLVDAYAAAISADPHLGGALFYPASYSVYMAPVPFAGVRYHAAQFWHTLTVQV